jgi:hypothetical protein
VRPSKIVSEPITRPKRRGGSRERKCKPRAIGQKLGNAVKESKNAGLGVFFVHPSTEIVDNMQIKAVSSDVVVLSNFGVFQCPAKPLNSRGRISQTRYFSSFLVGVRKRNLCRPRMKNSKLFYNLI